MNKTIKLMGVALLSSTLLAGCIPSFAKKNEDSKPKTEQTAKKARKTVKETPKEDNEVAQVKKDASVFFSAMFAGENKGFSNIYGTNYNQWTDDIIEGSAERFVEEEALEGSEWTVKYWDTPLSPEEVYTLFSETRREMFQEIGDGFEIQDVKIDGDEAIVTVETRTLNAMRIAQVTRSIRTILWGDDAELVIFESDNPDLKKAVVLLNYYLTHGNWDHKFTALDPEFTVVPVTKSRHTFEVRFYKNGRKNWQMDEEDYRNFIGELTAQVDDYDDWENPEDEGYDSSDGDSVSI